MLPPEIQSTLSKAGLKKYWLVDAGGNPIDKPFNRRSEVELYEASQGDGDYEIITNNVGRPKLHESEQARKAKHDRERSQSPDRKKYLADWIKKKRSQQSLNSEPFELWQDDPHRRVD